MIKYIILITILSWPMLSFAQESGINMTDDKGEKTGLWIKLDDDGNKQYEGNFKNGHPVDTLIRYYPDETIKALMIYDSTGLHVSAEIYDENGSARAKGKYIDRQKHGKWSFFSSKGAVLMEINYKSNIINGAATRFFTNGIPMEKTYWENGVQQGMQQVFNEDGMKLSEFFYRDGKLDGVYIVYYPGGDLAIKGNYQNNLKEGDWVYYLKDGRIDYTLNYIKGKPTNTEILDQRQKELFDQYEKDRKIIKDPNMYLSNPESYFRK